MSETKGGAGEQSGLLVELLNKAEALIECGAATRAELAMFLLPEQGKLQSLARVSEWVYVRAKRPNGETALRLREWVTKLMARKLARNKDLAAEFRKAHAAVLEARKNDPKD